jgi:hypothetical protein
MVAFLDFSSLNEVSLIVHGVRWGRGKKKEYG